MPVLLILALLVLLTACSSAKRDTDPAPPQAAEILAAPVPDGVDPQLWRKLTAELARVVAERDAARDTGDGARATGTRATRAVAQGRGSEVRDFILRPVGGGATAVWTYRNQGDYDLNGLVTISDLTPIGAHFGKRSSDPNWKVIQFADGDDNGEVNISDVTPLGNNFGARVAGYAIQKRGTGVGAEFETVDFEPFVPGQPSSGEYPQAEVVLAAPQLLHRYRVVPSATEADPYELGVPSNGITWSGQLAKQAWNQAGANQYRNHLSELNGPTVATNTWEVNLEESVYILSVPVADRSGIVYCSSFKLAEADPPTLEGSSGTVTAVDRSGSVLWRYRTDAAIFSQPVLRADGTVIVNTYQNELIALYPDGKLRWKQQLTTDNQPRLWQLTVDDRDRLFALDSSPALRSIGLDGSILWTQPISEPDNLGAPLIAADWVIVPTENDMLNAFMRTSGAPDGALPLSSDLTMGALIKPATSFLWTGMSGPEHILGIPLDIGAQVGYISQYSVSTAPALNAAGEIVIGEQIESALPGEPSTGRIIGLNDSAAEIWDRPLSVTPAWRLASDAAGNIYCATYGTEADTGLYCINAAHNIEWFLPTSFSFGPCIAGEGFLATLVTEGDLFETHARLLGVVQP